jgi:hypothetical protein
MPRKKYTEGQIALVVKELENGAKVRGSLPEAWGV